MKVMDNWKQNWDILATWATIALVAIAGMLNIPLGADLATIQMQFASFATIFGIGTMTFYLVANADEVELFGLQSSFFDMYDQK